MDGGCGAEDAIETETETSIKLQALQLLLNCL